MQLIKDFGINPYLFVAQIVNFLIIFYVLKRYFYKPVLKLLKSRQDAVKMGVKQAEESRVILENAAKEQKRILRDAKIHAEQIVDDAKQQSDKMVVETRATVKKQTEQMLKTAQSQIQEEAKKAEQQLASHISNLAVLFLQKGLKDVFSEKDQHEVMLKAIKQLKKISN